MTDIRRHIVRLPWNGRVRRVVGRGLMRVMGRLPDPVDWAAHERIMEQDYFRAGLRPRPLADIMQWSEFLPVEVGALTAMRREQRRAAASPQWLTIGVYSDFRMAAQKPA